ncbi:MAG: glycosyltransferase family 4 protein [Candidatus Moraniibacteriota bacterium]
MKILFFNYEYPPLGGGAGNATYYILKEFSKIKDLEVDLITSSVNKEYSTEKIGENITVHKIPIGKNAANLHFQSQKDLLVYSWKALRLAGKLTREKKYNLSHSFFTVPCGAISLWLKLTKKIPYIVSLRGSDVPGYSERFTALYAVLKPLIRLIWKQSASVVSNSRGLKDLALKTNKAQKIEVIFNGVDTEDFYPDEVLRPKEKFIITVGATRITARKGINYLIEALSVLVPKYPNIFLHIMGDGNEKENLEAMSKKMNLRNNIVFLGRIPREKTGPYYREASLFVLPSLNEGMSNAMLEALASGLPILTTETGGTAELVKEGENGYTVKMKDAEDLAEKIEIIFKDNDLRKRMGMTSRELAERMSWKNVSREYFELYQRIWK